MAANDTTKNADKNGAFDESGRQPREMAFGRRMTDQEALMWNIEKDPWLNPNGASVMLFDRPLDVDSFRARLKQGVADIPRMRERVVPGLGRLSPPVWVTDREFDLDFHLRHVALPAPGSMRQLLDLTTRLYEEPYDRTRPLWMFYVVDGLEGGEKGAMIGKQHHAMADGIGALRMSEMYFDLKRRGPKTPDVDLDAVIAAAVEAEAGDVLEAGADLSESIIDTAALTMQHNLRRQRGIAARALGSIAGAATSPGKLAGGVGDLVEQIRSTIGTATGGSDHIDAQAPLWTNRSRHRHLEHLSLSLDDVKTAAKALGASVNDFFVAGAAIGSFAYHAERNTPAEAVNMSFVVSTRTDAKMGGNSFTPVPIQVPAGDIDTPEARLDQLREIMAEKRASVSGSGALSAISGVANLLPTSVVTRIARQQSAKLDLATSNLRGSPIPLYVAGAKLEAMIPVGPLAGSAANLTAMSTANRLELGLFTDPAAITEPEALARLIAEAYDDLIAAAG